MHISDGVLPVSVTLGGYAVSVALAAWSARRTTSDQLPKVAVVTSAFFVASLVHIPLGPTSAHLLLPGLAGALLGPVAFIAIGLGLLLQCLLFQFGGLTALGANALMMGLPAIACGWLFQALKGRSHLRHSAAGAAAGATGTAMAALFLAGFLAAGGEDFFGVAKIAMAAHVPVIVIEGAVSALTIGFLFRVKPELLEKGLLTPKKEFHG